MHPDCEAAVAEYLGRDLKVSEARDIETAVQFHMRMAARKDPAAWAELSPQERLEQGAQAAAQAIVDELKLKQRRVSLQIAAHDRIDSALAERFNELDEQGAGAGAKMRAVSTLLAFDPSGKGQMSAESWTHAIANESFGRLLPLWNSVKGFAHLFEDKQGVSDLVHELFGEDTANPAAKAGAKAWTQVTDELRSRANAAGMDIGKLEDWHYPQSWSQARVATAAGEPAASLDKFTADMLPLLDRNKYLNADGSRMSEDDLTHMLSQVFDTITTDGANKRMAEFKTQTKTGVPAATYTGAGAGTGLLADRMSAHRSLFFKDADSYLTAQGLYGESSIWPSLTGHIRSIARDIGLVETLGPNPEKAFKYFSDRTQLDELRQFPADEPKITTAGKYNESLYRFVSGDRGVVNAKIEAAGAAFRNFETATKLGRVVITALGDEAGMAATCFANKVPFSENFMRELTYLNPANGDDRDVAASNGLGVNRVIGGLNRFGQEDMQLYGGQGAAAAARNFTGKLGTGVLNTSGAEGMWDARRRALGSVLMSYLGKWTRQVENFKDLSFDDAGMLTRKGVTETDWQVWKRTELEDWDMKHGVLTPQSVWNIPDEKLSDLGDPTALKRHASTMLLGHVLEETGMGVMDTGARERSTLLFGTTPGTVAGELTRSALLFKSFSASMMMKHWARASSMPEGSGNALFGGNGKAQYAATLLVTGTIMGALATQLRNVTAGKNPSNMAEPQFWGEAFLRGGGLGFYGDFLYSELTSHDTSLIPALLGPLATEAENVWNLTGAAAFKAMRGERTDEGAKLIRFARGNIPFANMWYTQAAFDHLIWNNMQEAVSPGYLDRMQARAYGDRGTTYFWNPQEGTPSSAPDLAQAWQPERGREQIQHIADLITR